MSDVSGVGPSNSEVYKKDFNQSVKIFEESLDGYSHAKGVGQKETYKKAMEESLHVMDQISPMFNKEIQSQKAQLESDYKNYTAHESKDGFDKLHTDIDGLKEKLE